MRPIDADVLIDEIKKDTEKVIKQDDRVGSFWLGYIAGLVIKQPSIQSEPHEGEWINTNPEYKNGFYNNSYYCSECHDYYTTSPYEMKFCPNCGAKMKFRQNG